MDKMNKFYQESLKVNPFGIAISFLTCISLALILGYVYTVITVFIPIIYFNFLFTIGFGIILGLAISLLVRPTRNRSKKSQVALAVITGLAANYFQWTAYLSYAFAGEIPSFQEYLHNIDWIFYLHDFFGSIAVINEIGLWSIFGIPFNGLVLTFVWTMEALIILIVPVLLVYKRNTYPYSELLGK